MATIYLPTEFLGKSCYQVNANYIRVFETTYNNNSNIVYDIYINQDYQIKRGTANYSSTTYCDNINTYTDEIYYRTDFDRILLLFVLFCVITLGIPLKILLRLFRRFR